MTWRRLLWQLLAHGGNVSAAARDLGLSKSGAANLYHRFPRLRDVARALRGYGAGRRLTDEQAADIRRRAAAGEQQRRLAHEAGITEQTLYALVHGETYRSAGGPILPVDDSRAPLTAREKRIICRLFNAGLNRRQVARLIGLDYTTVCKAVADRGRRESC